MYFVLILLGVVAILFASGRIRPDFVALSALCLLILSGVLSAHEALLAFGDSIVIMVAALFVIGAGLTQTGVTQMIGNYISGRLRTGHINSFVSMIMTTVTVLGSFMSSTGVVAIFVPVVRKIAHNIRIHPSRIMMPLAYAGLISGMMTLIATPPNLIASAELQDQGYEAFGLLSFTPVGAVVLISAILYFLVRNRLVKKDHVPAAKSAGMIRLQRLADKYGLQEDFYRVKVGPESVYGGKKLSETDFRSHFDAYVVGIEVPDRFLLSMNSINADSMIQAGDILYLSGLENDIQRICRERDLKLLPIEGLHMSLIRQQFGVAELIIPSDSSLVGKTVEQLGKGALHEISVVASNHTEGLSSKELKEHRIRQGETLLVWGTLDQLQSLEQDTQQFILTDVPPPSITPEKMRKALTSLGVTALMIGLLILNLVPPVIPVLLAALLMVGTRCISMEESYKVISWRTVIVLGAMLPFAAALEKTGGVDLIANGILSVVGDGSPYLLMAGIFLLTAFLGSFISNTATAVILAPIVIQTAEGFHISPYPLAMALAIAASASYLTPVSSPVNMLVVSAGEYKFLDFVRIGLPLLVITMAVSMGLIPVLFPF